MDAALERERRLRSPDAPPPVQDSPLRAFLNSSLFYMPLAGLLAGMLAWIMFEPWFSDMSIVGGEVVLINENPVEVSDLFDSEINYQDAISITVGTTEVVVFPGETELEPGADGQPPFEDFDAIQAGMFVEASGSEAMADQIWAMAIRPATPEHARAMEEAAAESSVVAEALLLPGTTILIALFLLLAEGIASRNWLRMTTRVLIGVGITAGLSLVAYVPAGAGMFLAALPLLNEGSYTIHSIPGAALVIHMAGRSLAWASFGAALGLGMNLARSTSAQLRNSLVGGLLGGALGGAFFDPIDRFFSPDSAFREADLSRLVGILAVGLCVGIFVALVDRLAREAWVRVRTGPLAGKSFVIYKTPTQIGSSPHADIYLFKDAEIDATHASIHRVGNNYEIEDLNSRSGTRVASRPVRRHRLQSGDQIVLGGTVLEFEERAKHTDR